MAIASGKMIYLLAVAALCSLLLVTCPVAAAAPKTCKVLSLSGGGSLGAYEAGVIKGLSDLLGEGEMDYDVLAGVSAGTVNALSGMGFKKGKEVDWANFVVDQWTNMRSRHVYKDWPLGLLEGLLFESGLFNNEPLGEYLTGVLTNLTNGTQKFDSGRMLVMAATDVNMGERKLFFENLTFPEIVQAAMASAAIPGIFPISVINDTEYMDGGIYGNLEIDGGIERCIELGVNPEDIIVDVISCTPFDPSNQGVRFRDENSISNVINGLSIVMDNTLRRIINNAKMTYPKVNFRYEIAPNETMTIDLLDFGGHKAKEFIKRGIDDAHKIVTNYVKPAPLTENPGFFVRILTTITSYTSYYIYS